VATDHRLPVTLQHDHARLQLIFSGGIFSLVHMSEQNQPTES
jgi:hypothetical protein